MVQANYNSRRLGFLLLILVSTLALGTATGVVAAQTTSSISSVSTDNPTANGTQATGNYTVTLNETVQANVTLNLTGGNITSSNISSISLINGTAETTVDNSSLVNGNAVVNTTNQGELDIAVTFASGVNESDTFNASINSSNTNIDTGDSLSESFFVNTNTSSPEVDTAASSVTPSAVSPGASQEYRVNVTLNANNSLSDESGEVDVLFENFSLDTGETDLTINYTQSDISNGTLNVTKTVNATAPSTTGDYAVNVTDLRRENDDGSVDYLIADQNVSIANITVRDLTWAGSGTSSDPYIITSVSELQDIKYDLDANYKLSSDINASETANWNDGKGFEPIGSNSQLEFTGEFNGSGYTISNLTIDRPNSLAGLFEENGGLIKHVTIDNVTISASPGGALAGANYGIMENISVNGTVTGDMNVGGIAGQNNQNISDSDASVNVTATYRAQAGGLVHQNLGNITDSSASGYVEGFGGNVDQGGVGGAIGSNDGYVRRVSTNITVNGSNEVGGLVGRNYRGGIHNSSATGSVIGGTNIGGLVGLNGNLYGGDIDNSSASASVNGSTNVGGLVGSNEGDSTTEAFINSSIATGMVNGTTQVGGLVGYNDETVTNSYWNKESTGQSTSAGSATGLTTSEMTGLEAKTSMPGLDFDTTWETQVNDYPKLVWQEAPNESDSTKLTGTDLQTLAGTNATFEFALENTGDQNSSYILNLTVPDNWTPVAYSDDGGDRQDGEVKWLWQTIEPNETVRPSVTVEVPERINGSYTVTGEALTNESVVAQTTATASVLNRNVTASIADQTIANGSETSVTVDAPLSNGTFVNVTENATFSSNDTAVATVGANGTVTATGTGTATINTTYEGENDSVTVTVTPADIEQAIDEDNDGEIDDIEILTAIDYWQQNTAVPRTDGKKIGDFEILDLIAKWRYNTELQ